MSLKSRLMPPIAWTITHPRTRLLKQAISAVVNKLSGHGNELDFFFRVDDPYSYLLLQVLGDFCQRHQLQLKPHVVGTLDPDMYPDYQALEAWSLKDCAMVAELYNLDFPDSAHIPTPAMNKFMQKSLLALESQPEDFISQALKLTKQVFSGEQSGHPPAELNEIEQHQLDSNARQLAKKGHYLTGTLYYQGEWYWGIERLGYLERRLGGDQRFDLLRQTDDQSLDKTQPIELYFSLRSPYSYVALKRCIKLANEKGVELRVKPVLPMMMRGMKVPSSKKFYILNDAKREADFHNVPFGYICDPLGKAVENCYALFEWAQQQGKEINLLDSFATGVWSQGLDGTREKHMQKMIERAGLDWLEALNVLQQADWLPMASRHREEIEQQGLWGVPVIKVGDSMMWGQDKLGIVTARGHNGTKMTGE